MTIRKIVLLFGMACVLSACGGESAANREDNSDSEGSVADEEGAIEDTASEVVKTLADVNGFRIASEIKNPKSFNFYGTDVEITATVKDHSNNPVADGTVVTFIADDNGFIEEQCLTVSGRCTVTWTSGQDANYNSDYKITIMARTIGEDSFIDKNANKQFDPDEVFYTLSEAFIDANDNGQYDADSNLFDEFSDFNNNGVFDSLPSDSLFRGESCSQGARSLGHCAEKLEVWDSITLINSYSVGGVITLSNCAETVEYPVGSPIDISVETCYLVEFQDGNGNIPPRDTLVDVDVDVGEVLQSPGPVPNRYVEPGTGYKAQLRIQKADPADSDSGVLTIALEPLDSARVVYTWTVNQ